MEENKELMRVNEEIEDTDEETEEVTERSGIGTGKAMLIGSALTLAAIAVGKRVKKIWQAHKAKKEECPVEEEPVIIVAEPELVEEPAAEPAEPPVETPKTRGKK